MAKGNSLTVQWLGFGAFTAGARVRSLVRELGYCKPRYMAKKTKFASTELPKFQIQRGN